MKKIGIIAVLFFVGLALNAQETNNIDTYKVVFINGKYSSFLSETTHDTIDVCLMSSALTKPKYKAIIEKHFKLRQKTNLVKGIIYTLNFQI